MLSTAYRLRLESICRCIANKEEVPLEDMIWAEKLAKRYTTARDWLNKARRHAAQDIEEGSMDDFMNRMGLGDPDPSNYKTGFDSADEINDWFKEINLMTGGNVTDDIIVNMDGGVGGSWKANKSEFEKITPETYEKMNKEFEEEGLAFPNQRAHPKTNRRLEKCKQ